MRSEIGRGSAAPSAIALVGDLAAQSSGFGLEPQHHRDPGQIEALIEKCSDLPESRDVVQAVEPGAPRSALRIDQAGLLVRAQILHPGADHTGGDGDAEETNSWVIRISHPSSLQGTRDSEFCIVPLNGGNLYLPS